jgi:sorting nexin-29
VGELKIPSKLIIVVELTMEDIKCHVRIQSDLSAVVTSKNDLRQNYALACLLFNVAVEKIVRDTDIETTDAMLSRV